MFDTSTSTEDSFTELKAGVRSLPLPPSCQVSSPESAVVESTPRTPVSRALSFDGDGTPPGRRCTPRSSTRPSLAARRRSHRTQPSNDRLPRTSTTVYDDLSHIQPLTRDFTMPSVIISGCIEEEEERADLIGDLSIKHALPMECNSQHADLKTITPHTVCYQFVVLYSNKNKYNI